LQAHTRVISVVYVILAAVAVVAVDLRVVLIPAAGAALCLFGGGLIVFRRLSGALAIPWPADKTGSESFAVVVIEDTPLPFQGYDQELIVAVHARHMIELLACSLLAGATLYLMLFSNLIDGARIGAYEAEIICFAGLAVLIVNLHWFVERLFLRRSYYTVGTLLSRDPGFLRRGITYQFIDHKGERRGGAGPLWGRGQDNSILVLYDPNDPDTNVAHGGFLFHKFAIVLIPARNRQKISGPVL
jgi:hypothetical protein